MFKRKIYDNLLQWEDDFREYLKALDAKKAGASTTLSHRSASMIICKRQRSIPMYSVQTTALLRLILNFKMANPALEKNPLH